MYIYLNVFISLLMKKEKHLQVQWTDQLFPFTFEKCGNYDHAYIAELKFFPDGAEQAAFGPVAWEL